MQEMINSFFDTEDAVLPEDPSLDGKWSPAEVNQILFRNFGNPGKAMEELVKLTKEDLYGFTDENGSEQSVMVDTIPSE
jgi:hypothetical protein